MIDKKNNIIIGCAVKPRLSGRGGSQP